VVIDDKDRVVLADVALLGDDATFPIDLGGADRPVHHACRHRGQRQCQEPGYPAYSCRHCIRSMIAWSKGLILSESGGRAVNRGNFRRCADILRRVSTHIETRRFNKDYRSVRHQYGFCHRGKHTTCRPAKNKFPQPGMPVPTHDNEIGIRISCI
jgi:hypothetical protein